jgi:hypothetical protein
LAAEKQAKPKTGIARIFELAADRKRMLVVSGALSVLPQSLPLFHNSHLFYDTDVVAIYLTSRFGSQMFMGYGPVGVAGIAGMLSAISRSIWPYCRFRKRHKS